MLGSGRRDLYPHANGASGPRLITPSRCWTRRRDSCSLRWGCSPGAWTIDQTETMLADELDVWEATASLLDFALVRTGGDGRLAMPEPVRAYAHALLVEQGKELDRRRRHALMVAEEARAI